MNTKGEVGSAIPNNVCPRAEGCPHPANVNPNAMLKAQHERHPARILPHTSIRPLERRDLQEQIMLVDL
jgi:hypothetical protein